MTMQEAINIMVCYPEFKAEMKGNKKLQIYVKRWLSGEGKKTARDYLLKYGFTENYEQQKSRV